MERKALLLHHVQMTYDPLDSLTSSAYTFNHPVKLDSRDPEPPAGATHLDRVYNPRSVLLGEGGQLLHGEIQEQTRMLSQRLNISARSRRSAIRQEGNAAH
eukprot:1194324-Prorocentrum_minimum.AAC.10